MLKPTESEIALIREKYPTGGSAACEPHLPGWTRTQINSAAKTRKIKYLGPRNSGTPSKDDESWALPAHEYTDADVAFRSWPAAMPVVGTFSPSLGVVMGVAA